MRIQSSMFPSSNFFAKASVSQLGRTASQGAQQGQRRDQNAISPQGKLAGMLQQLADQKKAISERKNDLIGKTLESGGNMKNIQTQLDTYDEQLSQLDQQMTQLTADFAQRMTEQAQQKAEKESAEQPKTKEQADTARLSNLASAAGSVERAEALGSIQRKVEGEAKVKEAEIQMGTVEIERLESISIGQNLNLEKVIARLREARTDKRGQVSQLDALAKSMEADQTQELRDAEDKVAPDEAPADADSQDKGEGESAEE